MSFTRWLATAAAAAGSLAWAQNTGQPSGQSQSDREKQSPQQTEAPQGVQRQQGDNQQQPQRMGAAQQDAGRELLQRSDASAGELRQAGKVLSNKNLTLSRIIEIAAQRHEEAGKPVYAEITLVGYDRGRTDVPRGTDHTAGRQGPGIQPVEDQANPSQQGQGGIQPLDGNAQDPAARTHDLMPRQDSSQVGRQKLKAHIGLLNKEGVVRTVALSDDDLTRDGAQDQENARRQDQEDGASEREDDERDDGGKADKRDDKQEKGNERAERKDDAKEGGKAKLAIQDLSKDQLSQLFEQLEQQEFSLAEAVKKAEQQSDGRAVIARADLVHSSELRQSRQELWIQPPRSRTQDGQTEQQTQQGQSEDLLTQDRQQSESANGGRQLAYRVGLVDQQDRLVLSTLRSDGELVDTRPISGVSYYAGDARPMQQQPMRGVDDRTPGQPGQSDIAQQPTQRSTTPWIVGAYHIETFDIVRASQLIGESVRNYQDQDIGRVEDLAIDPQTGEVRYAALSFGGFLGIGDKKFAVPLQRVDVRYDGDVVMNIDRDTLEQAGGFDNDAWPQVADARFGGGEYRLAGDVPRSPGSGPIVKASDLIGKDVKNAQDENLGEIDDLIIDENAARVTYCTLSEGGWLGGGDQLTPVPFEALTIRAGDDDAHMQISKERLNEAPTMTREDLQRAQDIEWITNVYVFHNAQPYWQGSNMRQRSPQTPSRDVQVEDIEP